MRRIDSIALYVLSKNSFSRYAGSGIIIGLFFVVWLHICSWPLNSTIITQQFALSHLQHQQSATQQKLNSIEQLQASLRQMRTELTSFFDLPIDMQEQLFALITIARNNGLMVTNCEPAPLMRKDWCIKQPISWTMHGSFERLITFFSAMSKQSFLIECKQLVFQKDNGQIKVDCLFNFIYRTTDEKI